jgi:hypothetical protein
MNCGSGNEAGEKGRNFVSGAGDGGRKGTAANGWLDESWEWEWKGKCGEEDTARKSTGRRLTLHLPPRSTPLLRIL